MRGGDGVKEMVGWERKGWGNGGDGGVGRGGEKEDKVAIDGGGKVDKLID